MCKIWLLRGLLLLSVGLLIVACNLEQPDALPVAQDQTLESSTPSATPSETQTPTPSTPSSTPSLTNTLRPPPTTEAPTLTPLPSAIPTLTPSQTLQISGNLPPLLGLNTPTPDPDDPNAPTPETCAPREDWTLTYTVRPNDALANIAAQYNTTVETLAEGNCIEDPTLIRIDQILRVPGDVQPITPGFVCEPWELLTPFNGTVTVPAIGTITFNWNGPEAPRYLVRLYRTEDGTGDFIEEYLTEFQSFYTLDLSEIPEGGLYSWRVFPIGRDFLQIPCPESYHATFVKAEGSATGGGDIPQAPDVPDVPIIVPTLVDIITTAVGDG